ncbi:MAG: hypothetical protein PF487_06015 [Bacteroidales bacterium]|nr:hypothetical protein [Bacteroidales bacterium]
MKTRLIFVWPAWQEHSNKYFISIYKDRISHYIGLYPVDSRVHHMTNPKIDKTLINKEFIFKKLNKLDRIEYNNTKATHEIISDDLHHKVQGCVPYCVKLNFIQAFYLNWHFKKYIIQAIDFKKNILSGIIGVVFGVIATLFIQSTKLTNNEPNIAPIKEHQNQDVLKIDKNDTTILTKDSIFK